MPDNDMTVESIAKDSEEWVDFYPEHVLRHGYIANKIAAQRKYLLEHIDDLEAQIDQMRMDKENL